MCEIRELRDLYKTYLYKENILTKAKTEMPPE